MKLWFVYLSEWDSPSLFFTETDAQKEYDEIKSNPCVDFTHYYVIMGEVTQHHQTQLVEKQVVNMGNNHA